MVMKDKLEKANHKALYYRFKKFLISVVILSSAFIAIAIPTYISQKKSPSNRSLAQDNNQENEGQEKESDSKLVSGLLHY